MLTAASAGFSSGGLSQTKVSVRIARALHVFYLTIGQLEHFDADIVTDADKR